MEYTKPELEIVLLDNLYDVVTLSREPVGGGGSGTWDDYT